MAEIITDNGNEFGAETGNGVDGSKKSNNSLIAIKSLPRVAYGRDLKLREDDIIVAIDGDIFRKDVEAFNQVCEEAKTSETPLLVSVFRESNIYEILIEQKLNLQLDYAPESESSAAIELFNSHEVGLKDDYRTFEVLRDIHRHVVICDTAYSGLATLAPPFWLLQHRAWEPLAAIIAVYFASAAIHWFLFILASLLIGVYFHRVQHRIIRNYSLFTEHYYWLVVAARNISEAQIICRKIDPRSNFDFSHVGPPEKFENGNERSSKSKSAASAELA